MAVTRRVVYASVERIEGKTHAAVQDQHRDLDEQPGHEGEGAGFPLVAMDHLHVVSSEDPDQVRNGAHVRFGPHRHRVVWQPGRGAPACPAFSGTCRDHHVMAALAQPLRKVEKLDGRSGEVVRLRIELEDVHRRPDRIRPLIGY